MFRRLCRLVIFNGKLLRSDNWCAGVKRRQRGERCAEQSRSVTSRAICQTEAPRHYAPKPSRDERACREAAADEAKSAQSPSATGTRVGHGGIRFKTFFATKETILQALRPLPAAGASRDEILVRSGRGRTHGHGDCGVYAV